MNANVSLMLEATAAERPDAAALIVDRTSERLSYGELQRRAALLATGLRARGVERGTRALVFLKPGVDFMSVTFALARLGAVPIFIDPGLARGHFLRCVEKARAEVLISMRRALPLTWFVRRPFATVRQVFSDRPFPGAVSLGALMREAATLTPAPAVEATGDDVVAIAFTSGSTGAPRGVRMTHGAMRAQVRVLRELYGVGPGCSQLAVLPLTALLGPGLGCASVIPDLDASKPARARGSRIARALLRHRVTHAFGSPAVWSKLVRYAVEHGLHFPVLRSVLVGGAPVPPRLLAELGSMMSGEPCAPLGATEAVTVTSASGSEIAHARGRGTLVGRAVPGVEVRLVPIADGALTGRERPLADGEVGEIVVRGALVTSGYDEAASASRVPDASGDWHRMGDLGRFDDEGRLWFCGRKSERIETPRGTLFTACVEPLLEHPRVRRLAVVGIGERPNQRAAIVAEPASRWHFYWPPARRRLTSELLALGEPHGIDEVHLWARLPLDARHAAKILRGQISQSLSQGRGWREAPGEGRAIDAASNASAGSPSAAPLNRPFGAPSPSGEGFVRGHR